MIEFLQSYGLWIVLAVFFILMLHMHTGGGCGMGHTNHGASTDENADAVTSQKTIDPDHTKTHSSGGCH